MIWFDLAKTKSENIVDQSESVDTLKNREEMVVASLGLLITI